MKQVILLAICAFGLLNLNIRSQSSDDLSISSEDTLSQFDPEDIVEAAAMDNIDAVKDFIQKGADVDTQDYFGATPLMRAAGHGNNSLVKILLDNNANVNIQDDQGLTALMYAVRMYVDRRNWNIVKMLLRHGADVSIKNDEGLTVLDLAKKHSYLYGAEVVELLTEWLQKQVVTKN